MGVCVHGITRKEASLDTHKYTTHTHTPSHLILFFKYKAPSPDPTHSMERDYVVNTKRRISLGQILEAGYQRWLVKKNNNDI